MNAPASRHQAHHELFGLLAVFLVAAPIHFWIGWWDYTSSTFSDSLDYLMLADFYRGVFHQQALWPGTAEFFRTSRFPPLFPALLGAVGAGSDAQRIASLASNATAVLAAIAVWTWVRLELRDALVASAVALSLVLLPGWFLLNLSPVSEPLGLLLTATAFGLLAGKLPNRSRLLAAALLIGLAPLARSALLPLCVAFVLWLFRRPIQSQQKWLLVCLATLPALTWTAYRKSIGAEQYLQRLNAAEFDQAGISWPDALWQQPSRIVSALAETFGAGDTSAFAIALSALILGLAAAGCVLRLSRNAIDAWFLAGYMAAVLLWPFPNEYPRLLVAVYPFLLVSALAAVLELGPSTDLNLRRWGPITLFAAIVMTTYPALAKIAQLAAVAVDPELLGDKREFEFFHRSSVEEALRAAEISARSRLLLASASTAIPPSACLYSMKPQLTRVYSRRESHLYPPDLPADPAEARPLLPHCDYFVVGAWHSRNSGTGSHYPIEQLAGWARPVLVSNMEVDGRSLTVAAVFERVDAIGTGEAVP